MIQAKVGTYLFTWVVFCGESFEPQVRKTFELCFTNYFHVLPLVLDSVPGVSAFRIGQNTFCPGECLECPCIDLVCFHFYPFSFLFDKPGRSQGLVASDFLPWPVLLPPRTEPLRADLSTRCGAGTGHPPTLGLVQLLHLWGGRDWFSLFREGGEASLLEMEAHFEHQKASPPRCPALGTAVYLAVVAAWTLRGYKYIWTEDWFWVSPLFISLRFIFF